jgi:hypothetical protein
MKKFEDQGSKFEVSIKGFEVRSSKFRNAIGEILLNNYWVAKIGFMACLKVCFFNTVLGFRDVDLG